jgi:hypothetical protein
VGEAARADTIFTSAHDPGQARERAVSGGHSERRKCMTSWKVAGWATPLTFIG